MAKQIDYLITGIWYSNTGTGSRHISHVMFHNHDYAKSRLGEGKKLSKEDVIKIIKPLDQKKSVCCTAKWDYKKHIWLYNPAAEVIIEKISSGEYLKTTSDDSENDNLSHMINFGKFPM